jgi:glutamine amidotransferase
MEKMDATLVDAGTGNLHSVHNALLSIGFKIRITANPDDLNTGGRIILPGVGAFAAFMQGLRSHGLAEALTAVVKRGNPLLGICVGMQALFEIGEEKGEHAGLGLLPGRVPHFPDLGELKIPHTGWNQLWFSQDALLFRGLSSGSYAYFNHSYYCEPADESHISAQTDYGIQFASAVADENIYGVQFHPEKSQRVGLQVLRNFLYSE